MSLFVTKDNIVTYKVIIAGTRTFTNYKKLKESCDKLLANRHPDVTIVCGMARGADLLGKRYAEEKGYGVLEYPADWDKFGKYAGRERNNRMGQVANALIAFWDGKSRGTSHMIGVAQRKGIPVRIIDV